MGHERDLGGFLERLGWRRGSASDGRGAAQDCPDNEPLQATATERNNTDMGTLADTRDALKDPAIARRAAWWAQKYGEDRTQTKDQRQRKIQDHLMREFPLDRKVARGLVTYATREWV